MAFNFNRSRKEPMSEINVTPFVDVMLVLLIIFMVTAPLLTVGVQVDLPETNADTLQSDNEPLEVTIDASGNIFIQETEIGISELVPKMKAITENRLDTKIYVRGDEAIGRGSLLPSVISISIIANEVDATLRAIKTYKSNFFIINYPLSISLGSKFNCKFFQFSYLSTSGTFIGSQRLTALRALSARVLKYFSLGLFILSC